MKVYFELLKETTDGDGFTVHVLAERSAVSSGVRSDYLESEAPKADYKDKADVDALSTTFDGSYTGEKVLERAHFCDHGDGDSAGCKTLTIRDWTQL